jgi:predicted ATPase with chaperone activity
MNLFSRLRKSDGEVRFKYNNKSILIGSKQGLFDDIVGFEDVKTLFEMAIKVEKPVHLLLCGPPSSGKSLFRAHLPNLKGPIMQLEAALQSREYLIICLSIDHAILSSTK